MARGVNISKTAETVFTKNVFQNFLTDGNQLRKILGSKFKVATKVGEKIKFYITAEIIASEKPATGSIVSQSKGSQITTKYVRPKTYVVVSILDQLDMDSTGLNLSAEIEKIHSRAMGLKTDEIILKAINDGPNATTKNGPLEIDFTKYEAASGKKGFADIAAVIAGVARGMKKYLIVDSVQHADLLKNEHFINADYGTSGPVVSASLNGITRAGVEVLHLEDLEEGFHGTKSLIEKVTGKTDAAWIVTEESLCAGLNFADAKTRVSEETTMYLNYLIQTHMSLGVETLAERGIWELKNKK